MSVLSDAVDWLLLSLGDAAQWLWHDGLAAVGHGLTFVADLANPVLAPVIRLLNLIANGIGSIVFAPIGVVPGWLSNTAISAVTGVLLLIVYKHTSNQRAIGRVKDDIKANMLALKLFKDELSVTFKSQGRVFLGALKLLRYSLLPLVVMLVPVSLLLAQMGLWYQWRPLRPGEETLVTMKLAGQPSGQLPKVGIVSLPGAQLVLGPVRLRARNEIWWKIRAERAGRYRIVFDVAGQSVTKDLVVGEGLARVSAVRPDRSWTQMLLHPLEKPFARDSAVESISINYLGRDSWTSGRDDWLIYFFVASMLFALLFKPLINVRI